MTLYSDSSAAISACRLSGPGSRLRHVEICHFHIQEALDKGDAELDKVDGEMNPADIGTRTAGASTLRRLMDSAVLRRHAMGSVTGESVARAIPLGTKGQTTSSSPSLPLSNDLLRMMGMIA